MISETERTLYERTQIPFAVFNDSGLVELVSDGMCLNMALDRKLAQEKLNTDFYYTVHPDDIEWVKRNIDSFFLKTDGLDIFFRNRCGLEEGYRVTHAVGRWQVMLDGSEMAFITYFDLEDPEGKLGDLFSGAYTGETQLGYRDVVTGLKNVAYLRQFSNERLKNLREAGRQPVLLYVDVLSLHKYNQQYGYTKGDELIRRLAGLLKKEFPQAMIGRGTDDHFILIDTYKEDVTDKIESVNQEVRMKTYGSTMGIHAGICVVEPDMDINKAVDCARRSLKEIKEDFNAVWHYYSPADDEKYRKEQYIIDNLDRAIEEDWIQVYYQPIVRSTNGKVCEVEALARWNDPVRGLLSPASFIPVLEEAKMIPKLDLYVVRKALRDIKAAKTAGFRIIPVSINFSRADFDVCDLVKEICTLVDEAQVDRGLIHIEITESIVGRDFDYMKEQIKRFRTQGFQVWMDDFGSGYSSLDVLQSVEFDLIKFDMGFMRRLDEGENGKIILTDMMRMATSLGVDTVCEGVETEEQVRFLQEIGCSKMQGYYYMKPALPEQIFEKYSVINRDGIEDTQQSSYYDTMGRVSLYDLSFLANQDDSVIRNTFDTVPIGIMEVSSEGDKVRYVRSNQSFRDFMKRAFKLELSDPDQEYSVLKDGYGSDIMKAIAQCRSNENRAFIDEELEDGTVVHSFLRRIVHNPVNGRDSFAFAVLSVTEPGDITTYVDIARALATDYYSIYVIDLDIDNYVEYSSRVGGEELSIKRRGSNFFESARLDAMKQIYEEDRDPFLALFTRENVIRDVDTQGVFTTTYRLMETGIPLYVNMKITRMKNGNRLILGISMIDAQMKQLEEEKKLQQEKIVLGRIAALSPDYLVLYMVDPVTDHYTQYNPSNGFEDFGFAGQGDDFFADVISDAPKAIAPEDLDRHLRVFTKDNILREIQENGSFIHHYRLLLEGKPVPVRLRATMVEENEGKKILLGVSSEEEEYRRQQEEAQKIRKMNQTITSLLDNMPGLTFTKDAKTGVYLACNKAFAEYAHKKAADDVVGLTDAEIFDEETAAHFVADDRVALSMDRPYIFFEDVLDAAGKERQFQTTKLKYIDAAGRLCLQGMSQDVTDLVRMRRENVTTKEAYKKASNEVNLYTHVAHALARGYTDLYYVNMETDEFIEFYTDDNLGVLSEARRGNDFFEGCERDAKFFVHPEDQTSFVQAMNRQFLEETLSEKNVFELIYRRIKEGRTFYVQMKVSRMEDDERYVVIAVSDIDELMRQRHEEERIRQERIIYARLHAITGNYIVVYVVDPETGHYREFDATNEYEKSFAQAKGGSDFFTTLREAVKVYSHPADRNRVLSLLNQGNVLEEIERNGIYSLGYRIIKDGKPLHIQLKAAMVEEKEGPRLVVGLNDIDAQVRQAEELEKRLAQAQDQANIDVLTGVKNMHALFEEEKRMNLRIAEHRQSQFAVIVFDVNDLKKVNDTAGHQVGDQCLRDACKVVCDIFKHSPVYRAGGDEFAVIATNGDYEHLAELLEEVNDHNEKALQTDGIVIACGMAKYDDDASVATVFERADHNMYENKKNLKERK